ncbi:MAG: cell division topological specificity factor MinE [Candidatus Dadabacteria bacterium]|nr:MAG: cell division topological specificity factor MinE [Candidatus Dadabacteria bacterium]
MKVFEFLTSRLFRNKHSGSIARSRLHFVLVQDRSGLTNEEMVEFRKDMIDVMKKYFIIDDNGVEVSYERNGASTTLVINSPVLRRRVKAVNGSAPGGKIGNSRTKSHKEVRRKKKATQQGGDKVANN